MPCRNLQDEVFTAVPFQVVPSSLDMFDYNGMHGAIGALRFDLLGKRIAVLVRGSLYTELLTSNMTSRSPSEGFPVKFQEWPIKANTVGETANSIVITEANYTIAERARSVDDPGRLRSEIQRRNL
ncbi:hypothetical protein E4U45_007312 [Claviceps purpurea]|nr:hypothetical protein E4U45_007312 [Claviceps purpurea]